MMGRFNNSVDIIPVNKSSASGHARDNFRRGGSMNRYPYMSDPHIVARVQQYLEANVQQTYIDITTMADDLQRRYREYSRRRRSQFRALVKKAYSIVLASYSQDDFVDDLSSEDSDDSNSDANRPNDAAYFGDPMLEMYANRGRNVNRVDEEDELIDISSDDDNNDERAVLKATNGPQQHISPPLQQKQEPEPEAVISQSLADKQSRKRKYDFHNYAFTKKRKESSGSEEVSITFKDLGGIGKVLEEVCKLLLHIKHPEVYRQIGISPPRGFLLHGPPGCGKTLLANAIAGELGVALLKVAGPEIVAGVSGESEERIRELFRKAIALSPCVLFIDEIDAITPNRQQAQREMERRIVAQLLSCLDELGQSEAGDRVLVIGATNRPDSLDPALRRAGRFDREVCLGIPNIEARAEILKVLTSKLRLAKDFDYNYVAKYSPGFVGADLLALTREAAMAAVNRVFISLKAAQVASGPLLEPPPGGSKPPEDKPADKSDDVIVDDKKTEDVLLLSDTEKPKDNDAAAAASNSDNAIVIIDDEVSQIEEKSAPPPIEEVTVKLTETVPFIPKSHLEELISWLHNQAPLTTDQLSNLCIEMIDFENALKVVQPSAKREGFATVPDVTWDDVGSLQDIREELQMAILGPVRHAEQFKALGLTSSIGVLLCGPPGCGKTLLAKAVANEAGINFISVKGPELLNMYVGESERAVRLCFQRARNSAPCVIFFDELDALCPKRSETGEGGVSMRVVNQMLTEMDGVESRQGVYLMAASNRPDIIDPAVLRPGRLDKILYVGLPSSDDRVDILRAVTKNGTKPLLSPDVNLELIGKSEECDNYTGADLAALVREAGIEALKEFMFGGVGDQALVVNTEHFKRAVAKIRPSVSDKVCINSFFVRTAINFIDYN